MKRIGRVLIVAAALLVLLLAAVRWYLPRADTYQVDGRLAWPGLDAPVEVMRDENGMATVYAESLADLIRVQGFVTAQDRLFPMHLARLASQGRLSELAGEVALPIDTYRRTLGFHRLARAHAAILDDETRAFFGWYVEGVNRVIEQSDELPMAFGLAGIEPESWTIEDSLSILYYMAWGSSANLRHEVVAQLLVEAVGDERARELTPININPDDPTASTVDHPVSDPIDDPVGEDETAPEPLEAVADLDSTLVRLLAGPMAADDAPRLGSNNWVAGVSRSPSGKPIVANDPHLDPRMIPGVWHPIGLRRSGLAAVGVSVPGIPGITIGRTDRVAVAVTNAYADTQDLYVETVDPDDSSRYLDAGQSIPFGLIEETVKVRDAEAPSGFRDEAITIRTTRRGPVITDSLPGTRPNATLSLRWAAAEAITPEHGKRLGFVDLLGAQSVDELDASLEALPMIALNFVFADVDGGIGWRVSGLLPDRVDGAGTVPWIVETEGVET
ncbi:MAG: penicillin acylase family protein, partial [Acidobacteriota bacterium]